MSPLAARLSSLALARPGKLLLTAGSGVGSFVLQVAMATSQESWPLQAAGRTAEWLLRA